MQSKPNDYSFKINGITEFQLFWITYEISKKCSDTELDIVKDGNHYSRLSILNSSLPLTEIESILIKNQIEYEAIPC